MVAITDVVVFHLVPRLKSLLVDGYYVVDDCVHKVY